MSLLPSSNSPSIMALPVTLLLLLLLSSLAVHASQPATTTSGNCLFISRQKDSRVLVYADFHLDEHQHFDPIEAMDTNFSPTGIAFNRNLIYVGSYGRTRGKVNSKPNIEIFDLTKDKRLVGDLSNIPEIQSCFPEALLYHLGYLYVTCGIPGYGILKIEPEKKYLKAIFGKEIPVSWGLTVKDNYLYISSHCHDHSEGSEAIGQYCNKTEHDKIFRVDLTKEGYEIESFASFPGEKAAGLADISFGPNGDLAAISFHRQTIILWNEKGEYVREVKPSMLEFPIGIVFRGNLAYYPSPGRGEISYYNFEKNRQDLYAHPGPLLNSGLSYLVWARCPLRKKDEL